jgi:hypothetical protein
VPRSIGRVGGRDAVRPPYVDPVVLVDVPADALILREETFGPVLPVVRARHAGHAVELANANPYGLGAAVFAGRRADRIARALRSGMTSINSVLTYAGIPSLPLGGVGESGFGRVHGPDGLREFTRPKAITRQRFPCPSRCRASTARLRPPGRPPGHEAPPRPRPPGPPAIAQPSLRWSQLATRVGENRMPTRLAAWRARPARSSGPGAAP